MADASSASSIVGIQPLTRRRGRRRELFARSAGRGRKTRLAQVYPRSRPCLLVASARSTAEPRPSHRTRTRRSGPADGPATARLRSAPPSSRSAAASPRAAATYLASTGPRRRDRPRAPNAAPPAPGGVVVRVHDALGWWANHDPAARSASCSRSRRGAVNALGVGVTNVATWQWPFADDVDSFVYSLIARGADLSRPQTSGRAAGGQP